MAPSSYNYTLSHFPVGEQDSSSSSSSTLMTEPKTQLMARDAIVSSLIQILEQPLSMLRDETVGDRQMAFESQLIPGSSFGKHLRHVHDHYKVLLNAVEDSHSSSDSQPISLDYDKRMREPPLETNAKAALAEFEHTQQRVRQLFGEETAPTASSNIMNRNLDRSVSLSATTPAEVELGSTLGREMWFVCLHAIHHFALARVILVHELGLKIGDEFGVAPSTLLFREWNKAIQSKL